MQFLNYQDLLDGVADWINREDSSVTDRIPDFVYFGENYIFRRLRTRFNENVAIYPDTSDNTVSIQLPDDFKEVKLLKYDEVAMTRRSEQYAAKTQIGDRVQQRPTAFYREQNRLYFFPPADANAEVELYYYTQEVHISGTFVPQLYLETPELYLYAALWHSRAFLKATDAQTIAGWKTLFDEIVADLQRESDVAEYAGGTVTVSSVYGEENTNAYIR